MSISRFFLTASAAVALATGIASAANAAVVNIEATNAGGTTVALGAGTYTVSLAGIAGGGLYDGFSYWPETEGCDSGGANCDKGWVNHFAIDFGSGGLFDRTNGTGYGLAGGPGFRPVWDTAARALLEYSTRPLQSQSLSTIYASVNPNPPNYFMAGTGVYNNVIGSVTFTLASAQDVNFFLTDSPHSDNRGGVSLSVLSAAVPEPGTWAMMIAGFGLVGASMRRRRNLRVSFV